MDPVMPALPWPTAVAPFPHLQILAPCHLLTLIARVDLVQ